MSGKTVVIGVDGSGNADTAFNWTLDNLLKSGDSVIAVHCPEIAFPFSMQDTVTISNTIAEEHKRVDNLIAKYAEVLKKRGITGKAMRLDGTKPGEAIVAAAAQTNANMIVTGTRGLGAVKRAFLGSVSDYVVKNSSVPVTVYKESE